MFCGLHNKFISTYLLYYIIDHWLKLPKYVAEQIRPVGQSLPSLLTNNVIYIPKIIYASLDQMAAIYDTSTG